MQLYKNQKKEKFNLKIKCSPKKKQSKTYTERRNVVSLLVQCTNPTSLTTSAAPIETRLLHVKIKPNRNEFEFQVICHERFHRWFECLDLPSRACYYISRPEPPDVSPSQIRGFQGSLMTLYLMMSHRWVAAGSTYTERKE